MVTKYDVFYVLTQKGDLRVTDIVRDLHRRQEDYRHIHNLVVKLEKEGYVKRNKRVHLINSIKTKKLFRILLFCLKNSINYNTLLKNSMLHFLKKAAKYEYFTRKNVPVHAETFHDFVTILHSFGLLLIISNRPLTCKLLPHHLMIEIFDLFELKVKFYQKKGRSFIPKIEREFRKFRKYSKAHQSLIMEIEKREEIKFIHMSLSLEGNPITLPDTQRMIVENIVPKKYSLLHVQEIANYKKAVDLMMEKAEEKEKLTLSTILHYHKLAMNHIYGAGEIRKQNVHIKGNPNFKTCEWRLLSKKISELMNQYDEFESKKGKKIKEIIAFAAYFHNEFQRIHPFIDGNSRMSRLLLLHILRSYGIRILDFPLGYFDEYMGLTKLSKQRDDESFQRLVEEIVFFNLKKLNEKLI